MAALSGVLVPIGNGGRGSVGGDGRSVLAEGEVAGGGCGGDDGGGASAVLDGGGYGGGWDCSVGGGCCGCGADTAGYTVGSMRGGGGRCGRKGSPSPGMGGPVPTMVDVDDAC